MEIKLDQELKKRMIEEAANVRLNARVCSGFHVGAALLTSDGNIFTGCNMEISSTMSSICAERCAISKAVSMGYTNFVAIAVVSDAMVPVAPCGFCRQYLIDFGEDILVVMADAEQNNIVEMTASELLPMAFSAQKLIHD